MKNNFKPIGMIAFIVLFMFAAVFSVSAQQHCPEGDFEARPIDGGRGVVIDRYRGNNWHVRIPPTIRGIPVVQIGRLDVPDIRLATAFAGRNLISVTIPNSVIVIGEMAFANNQLTSITIPNSVTTIWPRAFCGNPLTSITIGANVIMYKRRSMVYPSMDLHTIASSITTSTLPTTKTAAGRELTPGTDVPGYSMETR